MPDLLVVDDDPIIRRACAAMLQQMDFTVLTAATAQEGLSSVISHRPDIVLLDLRLPDLSGLEMYQQIREVDSKLPVIFITADEESATAIEAMKLGAFDYIFKPIDFSLLSKLILRALEIRRLMRVPVVIADEPDEQELQSDHLIGRCFGMQEVYKAIGQVASQNVCVLIHGESGTGKELIARALYQHSLRSEAPFLTINCAAIPETLLESELFGHEKGAFTGAETRRIGKFEQCSGGTLFLDEIGDMTPLTQSKILRVLQEQQFERVGGNETVMTDVRVIAATNRNLDELVSKSLFRVDLYYRLSGFEIVLPPLRARTGDLPLLCKHFLNRFSRELGKDVCRLSDDALEVLDAYEWPGNVRELQSVLKQALLRSTGPVIIPEFFPAPLQPLLSVAAKNNSDAAIDHTIGRLPEYVDHGLQAGSETLYSDVLAKVECFVLVRVLQHASGNQTQAAKILGISRSSLRYKIRALGIQTDTVVEPGI